MRKNAAAKEGAAPAIHRHVTSHGRPSDASSRDVTCWDDDDVTCWVWRELETMVSMGHLRHLYDGEHGAPPTSTPWGTSN